MTKLAIILYLFISDAIQLDQSRYQFIVQYYIFLTGFIFLSQFLKLLMKNSCFIQNLKTRLVSSYHIYNKLYSKIIRMDLSIILNHTQKVFITTN